MPFLKVGKTKAAEHTAGWLANVLGKENISLGEVMTWGTHEISKFKEADPEKYLLAYHLGNDDGLLLSQN